MTTLRGDLHVHTCLSPCADDNLTPAIAVGMAKLAGAELIAVTDHNSARNLPAAQIACQAYGIHLLPGIEVNTAEEIHLLCYFPSVETALEFGDILYHALPEFPYDPQVWGRQLVMDVDDHVLGQIEKLLTGAVRMSLKEVAELCRRMGGVPAPAHADADSYSVFSVLGGWPMDVDFDLYEIKFPQRAEKLMRAGLLPADKPLLTSSDAHYIEAIGNQMSILESSSPLLHLLK